MKSYRQAAILEIVDREAITSQEQLRERLRGLRGIEATQATLSRDIRDLGLIKRAADGAYRRAGAEAPPATRSSKSSVAPRWTITCAATTSSISWWC